MKDISDILMDTGLGIRNYSVMEQGKIDLILSNKPQDRRRLIEEAAGITKYKTKRRAAELKLEETQQNLLRIDDTLSEVTRNLNSLKRQAAKARRHKELSRPALDWRSARSTRDASSLAQDEQEAANAGRRRRADARERAAPRSSAADEAELAETRTVHTDRAPRARRKCARRSPVCRPRSSASARSCSSRRRTSAIWCSASTTRAAQIGHARERRRRSSRPLLDEKTQQLEAARGSATASARSPIRSSATARRRATRCAATRRRSPTRASR